MTRALRLGALALLISVTIGASSAIGDAVASLRRQDAALPPVEVGAGPIRERSLAFVGRAIFRTDTIVLYGYFTDVIGLDRSLVFTDPAAPSEATARFTYAANVGVTGRTGEGDVATIAGSGTLTVYFDEAAGADWDEPASFANGATIAEATIRLRYTLQRQSPTLGVVVGDAEITQATAPLFTLGGERYRFGHVGLQQLLRSVGAPTVADQDSGSLVVGLVGSAAASYRVPNPPVDGEADGTVVAATPEVDGCPGIEPWLGEARGRLLRAGEIGAEVPITESVDALEAEAIAAAAAEVAALATAQRQAEIPEAGEEANQLAVTALSTYARGLNLLAAAATEGDEAIQAQAGAVLADGETLIERALAQLDELAAACGVAS